jgi:hypothetical protein
MNYRDNLIPSERKKKWACGMYRKASGCDQFENTVV